MGLVPRCCPPANPMSDYFFLCAAVSCLFDLQDGGVGLHDGHDDFVDIVLEPVVDLFLFVDRLHQLQIERQISIEIKCLKVNLHDQYQDVF